MNTRMLKDPMLYVASILSSFFFGFVESFVGIFNFNLSFREVTIIVFLSVVGIFFSLVVYALLSDTENRFKYDIQRDTRERMLRKGYQLPRSSRPNSNHTSNRSRTKRGR
jgi:hypothetical protein